MNKQNDRSKKSIALGLLIIAGLVLLFWYLLSNNFNLFAGLMAGLTPSMITIYLQRENQEQEHRNWLLRDKNAFLVDIMDIFTSISNSDRKMTQKKLLERIKSIQPALLAHASSKVLKAWDDVKNVEKYGDVERGIRNGERFFRVIRKDLGHDDSDLLPGAIMATIIIAEDKQEAFDACKGEKYD